MLQTFPPDNNSEIEDRFQSQSTYSRGTMRVLLVEDNDPLRDTLVDALTEDGYLVDSAADGEVGMYRATECS